jgi:ferritin-like metal-binding protein YciE
MESAREFCIHELNDILDGERKILKALEEQIEECSRPELVKGLEAHHGQTEKQIERLEQCFEELNEQPESVECKGVKGLVEEHDSFMEEDPSEELIDIFNCGAAIKVEHYEIASYEGLIRVCQQLGLREVVKLLNQNLKEEQQMLRKCEALAKKLKFAELGMEEEEEIRQPRRRRAA